MFTFKKREMLTDKEYYIPEECLCMIENQLKGLFKKAWKEIMKI
jgi:hypothetical protein